jgi:hypothetical protein
MAAAQLTSRDLQYNYSKRAVLGDDPRLRGLDSALFSGHEEYEVLSLINRFLLDHNKDGQPLTKADGLKVERMLQQKPGDIRSREHVAQWIRDSWAQYN